MKRKPFDGGPAFPKADTVETQDVYRGDRPTITDESPGMSLRDWFAGQALAGLMANSDLPDLFSKRFKPAKAAEACYAIADGMLAERRKTIDVPEPTGDDD